MSDPLFALNRLVDCFFIVQMVAQFFLIFSVTDRDRGTRYIDAHGEIIRHYLKGWFTLDFLGITAGILDVISLAYVPSMVATARTPYIPRSSCNIPQAYLTSSR
jgi:hypothetical protein